MTSSFKGSYILNIKLSPSGRSFSVLVEPSDTVTTLKQRIFERAGIPLERQQLIKDKLLEPDNRALSACNLKAGDMVHVTGERSSIITSSAAATEEALAKQAADADPSKNVGKLRASTIQHFATVTTVLKPHEEADTKLDSAASTSRWPRNCQAYCVYTRKAARGELTGIITFGLSNPYRDASFFVAIGIGIEIVLECPTSQTRLTGPNGGAVTGATISDSWMFAIVQELAHQCFALGLQIRQKLEKVKLLSVEIAGVKLPPEYLDPKTGRCCVLLGHLGDPDVPRGFNVNVLHHQKSILQSVLFVPARVLTFEQCQALRKDGADARQKLAEKFVETKSFSICDVPADLWPKLATELGTVPNASPSKEAVEAATTNNTPMPTPPGRPSAGIMLSSASSSQVAGSSAAVGVSPASGASEKTPIKSLKDDASNVLRMDKSPANKDQNCAVYNSIINELIKIASAGNRDYPAYVSRNDIKEYLTELKTVLLDHQSSEKENDLPKIKKIDNDITQLWEKVKNDRGYFGCLIYGKPMLYKAIRNVLYSKRELNKNNFFKDTAKPQHTLAVAAPPTQNGPINTYYLPVFHF